MRRRDVVLTLSAIGASAATPGHARTDAAPRWLTLPPTPALPPPTRNGLIPVAGARLFVAEWGAGPPLVLLHGGLAHSGYWAHQIGALATRHRVVAIDTRGHGRSTNERDTLSYDRIADDALAVCGALQLGRPILVGWSDGAIAALLLAIRRPERLSGLVLFGANYDRSGTKPGGSRTPVFAEFTRRAPAEYAALAPDPGRYPALVAALGRMWATEPNIARAELASVTVPTAVMDGAHDEVIRPQHTADLARAIPGATLIIERDVSHFAMLQDPAQFNADLLGFLGQ